MNSSEKVGFEQVFKGKTLDKWEVNPNYARVENGIQMEEVIP